MQLRTETDDAGRTVFHVKVVPGASRDRIVGLLGDSLKIAVSKPPQAGAANRAVIEILAQELQIPASRIEIVRGHTNPRKQVAIAGMTAENLIARLELR